MGFRPAAAGQDAQHRQAVFGKERRGFVPVGQVGGGDRRLGGVGLGKRHFGIGVDKGLLAGSASPFERTGIEGILRVRIARVRGFDPAAVFAVLFFSSPVPQPALQ